MAGTKLYPRVAREGAEIVVRLEARPENAGEMAYGYFFRFDPASEDMPGFLGAGHRAHMRRVAWAHITRRVRHGHSLH